MKLTIPHLAVDEPLPLPLPLSPVPSVDRLFSSTLPAPSINNRQEVNQAAEAGEHGGRQVDLIQTQVLVLLQVAKRVAIRLVDHDPDGRQVKRGGGHVVRQVCAQPTIPSKQRDQILLVQEGEEEEGEGEEPEEDRDEQDKVDGAIVLVGGDGDPKSGSEHYLQDPDDSQKTLEELQDIPSHLRRLRRFGWHLSPPPVTLGPFFPQTGRVLCASCKQLGKRGATRGNNERGSPGLVVKL